jgi:hypothetical protein
MIMCKMGMTDLALVTVSGVGPKADLYAIK